MENKNERKISWKNWLIKRLLLDDSTREEVLNYIADNESDENLNDFEDNNEKNLIGNILQLHNKSVEDVMVPRAEIISIEKNQVMKEVLKIIDTESHSRMPVYKNNLDNVIGFLHVKDLLNNTSKENFKLESILREVLYVAPKSPILDLLKRMRSSRIHMGLVVDEFGGVNGLVTIEDLVEEIVGEIEDEHDAEDYEIKIRKINSETYIVDSSVLLTEIENLLNLKFLDSEKNEIDTIGGLVFYISGKIPSVAEKFTHNSGIVFEVLEASERRIDKIKIKYNNRDKLY